MAKRMPEDPYWVVLWALGHDEIGTAHKNGKNKKKIIKMCQNGEKDCNSWEVSNFTHHLPFA
jgi:hypothetical protein